MPIILSDKIIDLAQRIVKAGIRLTTAESCTGGLIAGIITAISGSSAVLDRGFVVYSNQAKSEMLGVREETIKNHGAVSQETAIAMAIGAINNSEAEISLAVTGIAGPSGGSPEKPVGLVHFAICRQGQILHHAEIFLGDRDQVRHQAIETGLELILQAIDL